MAFSEQFLNELRNRVTLVDIIGRRVKLTRKGRENQGLCPFHKEKTPSFTVNEEKGFYHCFGCQAHGSVFDFVMETEGLSFPEAVEKLAAEVGIDIPRSGPETLEKQKQQQSLYDVIELATQLYEKALRLPESKQARDYLIRRGLTEDTIRRFRIGFAPPGRNNLQVFLTEKNIGQNLALASGLLIESERSDPYERFRNRIMFPICDRRGRTIAFGGRSLGESGPKYLNSPETKLFQKGANLYGLHLAAPAARKAETLILTEGYLDVITLAQAGFENTVAPLGTALTEEQLKLIWKVVREPVLCFDGDKAGQHAALKVACRALPHLKPGYGVRFAILPSGEDPDSLIFHKGPNALQPILDNALPLSEILWHNETGGHLPSSAEDCAALEHRLKLHTRQIQDSTVRAHFSRTFGNRLWPKQANDIKNYNHGKRFLRKRNNWSPNIHLSPSETSNSIDTRERPEEILLAVAINHPDAMDEIGERLGTMRFLSAELDNIRQEVLNTLADDPELNRGELISHLNQCGYNIALTRILEMTANAFAQPHASLDNAILNWNSLYYRVRKRELTEEIEEAVRVSQKNPSEEASHRITVLVNQKLKLEEEVELVEFQLNS